MNDQGYGAFGGLADGTAIPHGKTHGRHRRPDLALRYLPAVPATKLRLSEQPCTVTSRNELHQVRVAPTIASDAIQGQAMPVLFEVRNGGKTHHPRTISRLPQ